MKYYTIIKGMSSKKEVRRRENLYSLRLNMVMWARKIGISQTAREYKTTRKTVRKWVRRYESRGLKGLENDSRAPHHIPHKTCKVLEERVIELRETHPRWGPYRLKEHYDLPISMKAISRIIRDAGLVRRRKKKWKKRRDLREVKKRYKPFEHIQMDTKDLSDIEKYWPQMRRLGLPRYEHTARDVRTGGTWYAYAHTNDTTNAGIFGSYLLAQLERYGLDTSEVMPQTDNGSEYIGNVKKKKGKSAFERVLEAFGSHHSRIPPGAKTWQSDVESFHWMVEDEFYDIEAYRNKTEFLAKAYAYQLYFNFRRKNRYKGGKTPVDILKESGSNISPQVFNLPPIVLDNFVHDFIKGGYHVGCSASDFKDSS